MQGRRQLIHRSSSTHEKRIIAEDRQLLTVIAVTENCLIRQATCLHLAPISSTGPARDKNDAMRASSFVYSSATYFD